MLTGRKSLPSAVVLDSHAAQSAATWPERCAARRVGVMALRGFGQPSVITPTFYIENRAAATDC